MASALIFAASACRVVRFSTSTTPRMSGVFVKFRMASDALFSRLANAVAVSTGSPMPGVVHRVEESLEVEGRDRELHVRRVADRHEARCRPSAGGGRRSGRIVYVRKP